MRGCRALSDKEIESLSSELSLRDRTILLLGIRTGYRISELLSLTIADVLDEGGNIRGSVHVKRANTKGKHAGQTVPIHEEAKMQLMEYLKMFPGIPSEPLFRSVHGRVDGSVFRKKLKQACSRVGIDASLVSTHSLRKTFASKLRGALNNDIAKLQVAMRHKNVTSTISYVSINQDEISNAIKGVK